MGGAIGLVLLVGGVIGAPPFFLLFYAIYEQQKVVGSLGMGVSLLAFFSSILALFLIFR
jgi:hypothetical protein